MLSSESFLFLQLRKRGRLYINVKYSFWHEDEASWNCTYTDTHTHKESKLNIWDTCWANSPSPRIHAIWRFLSNCLPVFSPPFSFYLSSVHWFFLFFTAVTDTYQQQQVEVTKASACVLLELIIDLGVWHTYDRARPLNFFPSIFHFYAGSYHFKVLPPGLSCCFLLYYHMKNREYSNLYEILSPKYCSANSSETHLPLQYVTEVHYFKNTILSSNKC